MDSRNNPHTNWPELYHSLNLQINTHALFVLDYADAVDPQVFEQYQTVILISGEGNTLKFQSHARPGVEFFDSIVSDQYPHIHPWMFHFDRTIAVNSGLNIGMNSCADTPLRFDALLGLQRPSRDLAYNFVNSHPELAAKTFMTYYGINRDFVPGFDHDLDPIHIAWSSENITIGNVVAWRSQILPVDVYQQTCYSLVCETQAQINDYSFFTEKIAKPMLARRPFVVLANQHYLRRLKQLGFQTFDTVIDESYDCESDHHTRWNQALNQMQWLSQQNSKEIYQQVQSILEHNQKMVSISWLQHFTDQITRLI